MSRPRLAALLRAVNERIDLALDSIDAQQRAIKAMRREGFGTADAETHLAFLAAYLAVHKATREKLLTRLATLPPPQPSN